MKGVNTVLKTGIKPVLAVLLIGILIAFGCSCDRKDSKVSGKIVLMVKEDLKEKGDRLKQRECINRYIAEYHKSFPKVTVAVTYVTNFPKDIGGADVLLISAENAIKYMASPELTGEYASRFMDLTGYYEQNNINPEDLLPAALSLGNIEKSQQWIPFNYDRTVIYADKSAFDDRGIQLPAHDWDYGAFIALVKQLTYSDDTGRRTGIYLNYHQPYIWKLFVKGFGGDWYDKENDRIVLSAGKSYTGFVEMFDLLEEGYARGYGFNSNGSNRSDSAMSIAFACQPERNITYIASYEEIKANPGSNACHLLEEGKLVMLPLPAFDNGNVGVLNTAFIQGFAVSSQSGNPDAAASFALFGAAQEGQKALISYYGGIPANKTLWRQDFWKKGLLSGENSEIVLMHIDSDIRDDYADAFMTKADSYNGVLRTRTLFAALFYRDYGNSKKNQLESYKNSLIALENDINETLRHYADKE